MLLTLLHEARVSVGQGARSTVLDLGAVLFADALHLGVIEAIAAPLPVGGTVAIAALTPYPSAVVRPARVCDRWAVFVDPVCAITALR